MKKFFFIILFICAAIYFVFFFPEAPRTSSTSPTLLFPVQENKLTESSVSAIKFKCNTFNKLKPSKVIHKQRIALNKHFKKDGEVYRIRIFLEDGDQGGFQKLVLYKEDNDGFPHMVKIPSSDTINPTKEIISKYTDGAEFIYSESEERFEFSNKQSFIVTKTNGKVKKIFDEHLSQDCN